MVRKRSRASRKYNSSDENDTESDYSIDDSPAEPAPKKYSLRQRKKTVFIEDFDYEDAEDLSAHDEDDEDFEFEGEAGHSETSSRNEESPSVPVDPAADLPDNPDELIDFEDVIRADIVMNKNRIDYDNLISKSEIKVQPFSEAQPVKARRGRKPKKRMETEIDSSLLEPETEVTAQYSDYNDDDDYAPDDFLVNVPLECVQTELHENNENVKDGTPHIGEQQSPQQPDSTCVDNHNNITSLLEKNGSPISPAVSQESVIKVNPLQVSASSFHLENPEVHLELKQESEDDDDDVVLIEDKNCEVIVLDD